MQKAFRGGASAGSLHLVVLALAVVWSFHRLPFGVSPAFGSARAEQSSREQPPAATPGPGVAGNEQGATGQRLFDLNCAHCHGDDARGDEGPNLYNLRKTDDRIATIIRGGIKGEMPAFGRKLGDTDVKALITYLRTLKD